MRFQDIPTIFSSSQFVQGLFLGQCAEYCGSQHSLMRIIANVVSQEDFDKWIASQQKCRLHQQTQSSQHGKELFMSKTCVQCHSVAGTEATALVHLISLI